MDYVLVNGELILDHGIPTGTLPGKILCAWIIGKIYFKIQMNLRDYEKMVIIFL